MLVNVPIFTQNSDCTVRALSVAASIPYTNAHIIAEKAGRKYGKKFSSRLLIDAAINNGISFQKVERARMTVARFLKEYPTGRFYARKNGHAFAIIDGVISDDTSGRCRVRDAWQLV